MSPFAGLAAYSSAKAGLRMAGMVLAAEWASTAAYAPRRVNAAIVSYEPGIVDTAMQDLARSRPVETFPWASTFTDFAAQERLVAARVPAAEIVSFLADDPKAGVTERRLSV
jgi:NAD(P)-dependent dehydrogenase (short-subunit alcohol dehydrogenase family)